jgi:hypothetical protein
MSMVGRGHSYIERTTVDLIEVSPEMDKRRATFLRLLFDGGEGYMCIAYGPRDRDPKKFRQEFFKFPNEIPEAVDLVNKVYQGHNVWFCPHLFSKRRRQKEDVSYTPCAWSDLDECEPGRYQGLWMFETAQVPEDAENLSHRIAYTHADQGADRTGWDLTQLLRFPYTYNYKYQSTPTVKIVEANRKRYRLTDFDKDYEQVLGFVPVDKDMPDISAIDGEALLEKNRLMMTPTIWRLYQEQLPEEASWSEPLWKLMMYLFEAGFEADQVFAIVQGAACNKWDKRAESQVQLWRDVARAEQKYRQNTDAIVAKDNVEDPLVSEEERMLVESEETFIERYITWAKSLGDAAPQYHQAGAFTALSALLAGAVQLPTSFGVVKPNLWFMILADTTLTRKSTAMDIAMDLIMEVDDDIIMATDGSIEGLLTSLGTRPGRPSVFLRDEFSGLLEMITKRDYYAGMPELLTKLYDGKMQKRILRKESIEVRDPCLLVFAGGIKNKITSLLSFEHVSSGFMPRFIFITAESDITRVRPLGPPTEWIDNNRAVIREELQGLYDYYNRSVAMTVKGTSITYEEKKKFNAKLTQEAWERYNKMEDQMLQAGIASERPEIMTPVYDRLAKSMLKCAVLLAASRKKADPVVVEERDVVRAMVYGENWRMYVREVMDNVGKGQSERLFDNIVGLVERTPGVSRSVVMQNYHLDARTTTQLLETLEQRGKITRTKNGRMETLWPAQIKIKEKA